MLEKVCADLRIENQELDAFVSSVPEADWARPTQFFGWTIRDQILHLQQVDSFGLASLQGADSFAKVFTHVRAEQAAGIELSEQARRAFADASDAQVLHIWRKTYQDLLDTFGQSDPKRRLTWFGPDMSLISFVTARQMEVWAHGQDIYDLYGVRRETRDSIRNICDIGVRTFGWSFRNRGLDVPESPSVTLTGPSGATWTWEGGGNGSVTGPALDFALVVTQRRAPEDTALEAHGDAARQWLPIAQCFAGAPQEPAAPGTRPDF